MIPANNRALAIIAVFAAFLVRIAAGVRVPSLLAALYAVTNEVFSVANAVACAAVNPNAVGVALINVLKLFDHVIRLASRPGRKLDMTIPFFLPRSADPIARQSQRFRRTDNFSERSQDDFKSATFFIFAPFAQQKPPPRAGPVLAQER
jgi:hypothetical protein